VPNNESRKNLKKTILLLKGFNKPIYAIISRQLAIGKAGLDPTKDNRLTGRFRNGRPLSNQVPFVGNRRKFFS
jgi:hypothetical protein